MALNRIKKMGWSRAWGRPRERRRGRPGLENKGLRKVVGTDGNGWRGDEEANTLGGAKVGRRGCV